MVTKTIQMQDQNEREAVQCKIMLAAHLKVGGKGLLQFGLFLSVSFPGFLWELGCGRLLIQRGVWSRIPPGCTEQKSALMCYLSALLLVSRDRHALIGRGTA